LQLAAQLELFSLNFKLKTFEQLYFCVYERKFITIKSWLPVNGALIFKFGNSSQKSFGTTKPGKEKAAASCS